MTTTLRPYGQINSGSESLGKTTVQPLGQWNKDAAATCYNKVFGLGNWSRQDLHIWWKLQDDSAGTSTLDSSGNTISGTILGGSTSSDLSIDDGPTNWYPKAFSMRDNSDPVVEKLGYGGVTGYPFSMQCWFRSYVDPASLTAHVMTLSGTAGDSYDYFSVGAVDDDSYRVVRRNGTFYGDEGDIDCVQDQWQLVTAVFKSETEAELYVDGVDANIANPLTSVTFGTINRLAIGGRREDVEWGRGDYAGASVHQRALTEEEAYETFTGPEPIPGGSGWAEITGTMALNEVITLDLGDWDSQDNGTLEYHYKLYAVKDGVRRLVKWSITEDRYNKLHLSYDWIEGSQLQLEVRCKNDGGFDPSELMTTELTTAVATGTVTSYESYNKLMGHGRHLHDEYMTGRWRCDTGWRVDYELIYDTSRFERHARPDVTPTVPFSKTTGASAGVGAPWFDEDVADLSDNTEFHAFGAEMDGGPSGNPIDEGFVEDSDNYSLTGWCSAGSNTCNVFGIYSTDSSHSSSSAMLLERVHPSIIRGRTGPQYYDPITDNANGTHSFYAITYDKNESPTNNYYQDNVVQESGSEGLSLGSHNAAVITDDSGNSLCGRSDVAIWKRNLSTSELDELMDGPEPLNVTAPVVTGTRTVGSLLSCTTGTWDSQSNGTITYSYQWQCDGVNISGATGSTYTTQQSDEGCQVTCVVRATNDGGYDLAEDTSSNFVNIHKVWGSYNEIFGLGTHGTPAPEVWKWVPMQDDAATATVVDNVDSDHTLNRSDSSTTADITTTGPNSWLPKALAFNSTAKGVTLPTEAIPDISQGFTITAWKKHNDNSGSDRLYELNTTSPWSYGMYLADSSGKVNGLFYGETNDAYYYNQQSSAITAGTWGNFAFSWNGEETPSGGSANDVLQLYADGAAQSDFPTETGDFIANFRSDTHRQSIGPHVDNSPTGYYDGALANFAFIRKWISEDEAAEIYNGPEPTVTSAPVVTGSTPVGSVLSCTTGVYDSHSNGSITYSYQWLRDGVDISGATSSTYTTVLADEDADVSCRVRATNDGGYDSAEDSESNAITVTSGGATEYTIAISQGSYTLTGQATDLLHHRKIDLDWVISPYIGYDVELTKFAPNAYQITCDQGSYTLSGQAAGLEQNRQLDLAQGSYSVSGQAVDLVYTQANQYTIGIDQGSYSLTGQDPSLEQNRQLEVGMGSFSQTGQDVVLEFNEAGSSEITIAQGDYTLVTGFGVQLVYGQSTTIDLDSGSYSTSGSTVGFERGYQLGADLGSYSSTGVAVGLQYNPVGGYEMVIDSGSYSAGGQTQSLEYNRIFSLDAGSYAVTGVDATLLYNRVVEILGSAYSLLGQDQSLEYNRILGLDAGSYALTGQDVILALIAAEYVASFISIKDGRISVPSVSASISVLTTAATIEGGETK